MPDRYPMGESYRVTLVTPELAPFQHSPVAETAAWLARSLAALGNRVSVIAPRHRGVAARATLADFPVAVGARRATAIVRSGRLPGPRTYPPVTVLLVDNYHYFDREHPYGYPDDGERYAFYCRAVQEVLRRRRRPPDVLHLHHWPCGPLALLQRRTGPLAALDHLDGALSQVAPARGIREVPCVFTIYDLGGGGALRGGTGLEGSDGFGPEVLDWLGLREAIPPAEARNPEGRVSFLRLGLAGSHVLSTVSRAYARELQAQAARTGLDGLLRQLSQRLFGVVNGIDEVDLNPRTDPRIYRPFSADALDDRRENKTALLRELGLTREPGLIDDGLPLLAAVMPLTEPGGVGLLLGAMSGLLARPLQAVVVAAGEPGAEAALSDLARRNPGRLAVVLAFNTVLIRRIYAGSDLFLVPSQPHPAATDHLAALRYGSVPVVQAVGSLADTVTDFDGCRGCGNGFVFRGRDPEALLHAVDRALEVYRQPPLWRQLVRLAMSQDHSWRRAAVEYMGLYAQARAPARAVRLA